MAKIPLTQGYEALVDAEDVPKLMGHKWHVFKKPPYTCYARAGVKGTKKRTTVSMHRLLMGLEASDTALFVDHINRNGLDNRRANLRIVTPSQNRQYTKHASGRKRRYRGVYVANSGRYVATIGIGNRTNKHLGMFDRSKDAARAYDAEASKRFGEFAVLNFPA